MLPNSICMFVGYRPLDTYPRSNTERNFLEADFNNSVNSGIIIFNELC